MNKKCKVIMLADDKATWPNCIWLGRISGQLRLDHSFDDEPKSINPIDDSMLPHHLYILSDEEIKEGDWITDGKKIWYMPITLDGYIDLYKVVASTDSSLNIQFKDGSGSYTMPSIPQSFIDKYVSEYNKGNKIEEVMVEYEFRDFTGFKTPSNWYLKLNPDNTINIQFIKDNWTREEVIALCKTAIIVGSYSSTFDFNEWIESNL